MGNSQPVFNRLEVPSFGLAWLNIDDSTGESVVLIPGGGGSTKSGVKNQIQIGHYITGDSTGGFEFLKSFETDVKDGKSVLCSGVAVGTCMGTKVVCAFLDNHCAILTVNKIGNELILKRVVDFKADFSEDGCVNCACILPSGHIVTGGDDGICRLWAVGFIKDNDADKPPVWRVRLLNGMEGHTAAIMDISHHPYDALISTAAKDGTCKIWNVVTGVMVCDVPSVMGLPGSNVAHKSKGPAPTGPVKMECRGCCFSNDGAYLYAIQSARRGSTHLVDSQLGICSVNVESFSCPDLFHLYKWLGTLEEFDRADPQLRSVVDDFIGWEVNQHGDDIHSENLVKNGLPDPSDLRTKVTVDVSRTKAVSKYPCTRLKISEGGDFVAIGASDGAVIVIDVDAFKQISSSACHDLPATGLGFAPSSTARQAGLREIVVSCSADNRLAMMKMKIGFSTCAKVSFVLITFLCLLALMFFSAIFFSVEIPPEVLSLFAHSEL